MTLGDHLAARTVLAERARALVPLADEQAVFADTEGRLADSVVARLHDDGLFTMWVPKKLGGYELGPVDSLEVLENLSYGDASAGWVLMAACLSIGTGGAYLSDEASAELFAEGKRPVIAGQGTRPGVATPADGGYRLSGSWSFASGIKHGMHIHTLAIIETTGEPRIFVVPVEKATLIDNWDVIGLRGTGSIDYTIDNVFVPEGFTHFAVVAESARGGPLYNIGIIGFAEICHSDALPVRPDRHAGWLTRAATTSSRRYVRMRSVVHGLCTPPTSMSASSPRAPHRPPRHRTCSRSWFARRTSTA